MRAAWLLATPCMLFASGCEVFLPNVWVDRSTGLMWERSADDTELDPGEAAAYCAKLEEDDARDWRLPDIDELRSLVSGCPRHTCNVSTSCTDDSSIGPCFSFDACDGCYDKEGPGAGGCYWDEALAGECSRTTWSATATGEYGDDQRWTVHFGTGEVRYTFTDDRNASVRCVRGP